MRPLPGFAQWISEWSLGRFPATTITDTSLFVAPYIILDTCGIPHGYLPAGGPDLGGANQYFMFETDGPWPFIFDFPQRPTRYLARTFAFKTELVGWSAMYDSAKGAIYKTLDGGLTWSASSQEGLFDIVGYSPATNRLFASDFDSTFYSTDDGGTWNLLFQEAHFNFEFSTPLNGVAGGALGSNLIYTSDGGITWLHSTLPGDEYQPLAIQGTKTFFAICERGPNTSTLFRSDDGAVTWQSVYHFSPSDTVTGAIVGNLCFLFIQTSRGVFESNDEGKTWYTFSFSPGNRKDVGMWSNGNNTYAPEAFNFRNDLGVQLFELIILPKVVASDTEFNCSSLSKAFHIAIANDCHNSILQNLGLVGSTAFQLVHHPVLPDTLRADDSLEIRYWPISAKPDTAHVILNLCTPAGFLDTTITIYGSGLPQAKPILLVSSVNAVTCSQLDTSVSFFVTEDCRESILKSATISGSSAFQLTRTPTLPDTLFADDSVGLSYVSTLGRYDTAYLTLTIQTPTGVIDTSIILLGSNSEQLLHLVSSVSAPSADAGHAVTLEVLPDRAVLNKSLNSIDFSLSFTDDVLDIANQTCAIPGATFNSSSGTVTNAIRTIPIHITGNNLSLNPAQPIVQMNLVAMLADSSSTSITLSDLQLNGGDPNYRCTLGADISSTTFSVSQLCGDPTIQQFLRQGNLNFVVQSIVPNPTDGKLRVTLSGNGPIWVLWDLYDLLGHSVMYGSFAGSANSLDVGALGSGSYYLRMSAAGEVVSRKVVVRK